MQLVFVHGVNVRKGELYDKEIEFRNRNFAEIFFRQLGHDVSTDSIVNPYWGDLGAVTSPDQPFLPKGSYEMLWRRLSHQTEVPIESTIDSVLPQHSRTPLLDIARNASMADAIDVIWGLLEDESSSDGTLHRASTEETKFLSRLAEKAFAFAHSEEGEKWLQQVQTDDELLERLSNFIAREKCEMDGTPQEIAVASEESATTSLKEKIHNRFSQTRKDLHSGAHRLQSRLSEDIDALRLRFRQTAVGTTAKLINNPMRTLFHQECALLIGDAFSYFSNRRDEQTPSPIAARVIESMEEAAEKRDRNGGKLIVVGHSMGGVILCDILTCYGKHIPVDLVITVGSQFPLFADMRMFPGVNPEERPVSKPANVGDWINIFDPHDFLGYPASHIFSDVTDYHLPTYAIGGAAHRDYFNRRSFYFHLARRLADRMR